MTFLSYTHLLSHAIIAFLLDMHRARDSRVVPGLGACLVSSSVIHTNKTIYLYVYHWNYFYLFKVSFCLLYQTQKKEKKKRNQYNNRKSKEQNNNQQIFTIQSRLSLLQFIVQLAFSFTHKSDDNNNNKQKAQK